MSTYPMQVWLYIRVRRIKYEINFRLIGHLGNILVSVHHLGNIEYLLGHDFPHTLSTYLTLCNIDTMYFVIEII